ncbi:DUF3017 domain-containing protein [Streptomyces sp. NPDC059142]|uniref:DUF3017 domain-containing protein n=1 Tax=Streptomyces sp. NPDC059142 TaxID=3346739 RepID=UPI0036976E7F
MGAGTSRDTGPDTGSETGSDTGSEPGPVADTGNGARSGTGGTERAEAADGHGPDTVDGPAAPPGPHGPGATEGSDPAEVPDAADGTGEAAGTDETDEADPGRRFALTRDTAPPEGGGRAAPRDAPAPARQWPLLSVLGTTGLGLLIVGLHPFAEAFRIGTILIGIALIGGAVLRRVLPSVGMLAVRSRFTDMLTYGLLGVVIVLLSLMTQPKPWLEIPFLEDTLHFTVR